jgi:hypothetical protein
MIVAAGYFLLDERFLPLPDFFAVARFRPPDLRAELLFLLADFRPELRLRLLPDFFAGARFLLVDLRTDFLADVFLPLPDFFADARFLLLPPDFFLPPLSCLLTVRQARSSASSFDTPFFS